MANEMNRTLGVEEKSVNNSVYSRKRLVNGSRTARIWQVVAPLLFVAFGLFGVNENAWGNDVIFNASVSASPSGGGTVSISPSTSQTKNSKLSWSGYPTVSATFTYSATANTADGYVFKGWATSEDVNSGTTTNPMSKTYSKQGGLSKVTYNADTQYAIFGRLTANKSSLNFSHYYNNGWGGAQSVTVTYCHANNVTATITGDNKDDFSFSNTSASLSKSVVTGNKQTQGSSSITIYFKPSGLGTRTATLTFSGNGMTKTVSLSGKLARHSQTISWGENMLFDMAIGAQQPIVVTSSSGLTNFAFSSDKESVMVIRDNEYLDAVGTGNANITVIEPGNDYYYLPDTLKTEFHVLSKETPSFTENGFAQNTTCQLKVGGSVNMNVAHVSDGLNGHFTAVAAKNGGVMGIVREGNTLTFTALHAGRDTITVTQRENNDIFGATRTYYFNVTRYVPEITLSRNNLVLDETATLTINNTSGHSLSFNPQGKVSYNGETGVITAVAAGTTTLTIHQDQTNSIEGKDTTFTITVSKKTPSLTVKMGGTARTSMSVARGTSVSLAIEKLSDANYEVSTVSGAQYTSLINNQLFAGEVGTTTYRANLPETDTYKGISANFSLTVTANSSYLPMTNNDGYSMGDATWGGLNWDDKTSTLSFKGIPDKLSFNYRYSSGSATQKNSLSHMYIEESADNSTWSQIWENSQPTTTSTAVSNIPLSKTTRYIRFHYRGNFAGYYTNINVTELKYVEDPASTSIDFGTADVNSETISRTTTVNWCNVAPVKVTCSNPRITVSPSSFAEFEKYATQTITVSYTPAATDENVSADITLSNGNATYNKTIHVTAKTSRRSQTINWNEQLAATGYAMNVDESFPNAEIPYIAYTANRELVKFSSLNTDVIEIVDDTVIVAKAVGNADVIAYQAGDAEYLPAKDTVNFKVTNLKKQTITWDQNLLMLLTTSGSVELNATASSGGEITYVSADANVVKVEGNVLTVVGEGETYITATQAGNEEYLGVSQQNNVIVRNPASQCNSRALSQGSLTLNSSKLSQEYNLSGAPQTLSFSAKHGTKSGSFIGFSPVYSSLIVEQYAFINDLWDWYKVFDQVVGTDAAAYNNIALDESATKIRFRTTETGTDHTITGISVSRKKYMRCNTMSINNDVECNATWQKTISVSHSNIDLMTVTSTRGLLNFSTSTLGGGCGDFGDHSFTVSFTPMVKYVETLDTIVITDGKAQPSTITIPVRLYSKGLNQSIGEFVLPDTVLATNTNVAVSATASSELDVIFVSSDSTIAYVAKGKLAIMKDGIVTITAKQEGNDKYDAATPKAQTVVILKAATSITTSPTAADITYGQTLSEATLSDGEGSVDGSFGWQTPATQPTAGPHSYTVVFTPKQNNIYATATTLVSVTVNQATPTISSWPTAGNITIAQSLGDSELEGGEANVEGTFAWKNPAENRLKPGTYERTMVFTPNDNSNYEKVEETVSITVTNVLARITTDPTAYIENNVYGFTLADVTILGGAANVAGSFGWKDSTTIPQAGTHTYPIVFTPEDLELYFVVEVEVSLTVAKADAVLTSAPTAKELTYTGLAQTLVNSGVTTGGVMEYSLDGSDYDSELPEATEIGSYTVYYRVAADNNYNGIGADNVLATIAPKACSVTSVSSWDDIDEYTAVTVTENQHIEISSMVSVYSLTIAENTDVTVSPTGGLTVGVEGITGATTDNLKLIANADGQTGYIRISPDYVGTMPQATIEMHSKAYYDKAAGDAKWQYVGSPVVDNLKASEVFTNSYIYSWNESTGKWVNNRKNLELEPFVGYATTQKSSASGTKMTYSGQLVDGRTPVEVTLQYTAESPEAGCNMLANSFAAPIDISRIEESDFSEGVEATIYLFNTGSQADIAGRGGSVDLTAAGQYISIPVNNAATLHSENSYPIVIPAMQGFYVTTNQTGTLTLDYRKLVWEADYNTHSNQPLRAPRHDNQSAESELTGSLNITLMTQNSADQLILLESPTNVPQFENGYDAHKKMAGELNIFSVEEEDLLAVDATNTIAGTWIGVRTGDASEYTFRFNRVRNNEDWFLIDTENGSATFMEDEAEYTFFAEPNQLITNRFLIERTNSSNQPGVATGFEQASDATIRLNGNTVELSGADTWALYNIEGKIIEQGNYSGKMYIDLSRYANGVYVVRNGQKVARIMR